MKFANWIGYTGQVNIFGQILFALSQTVFVSSYYEPFGEPFGTCNRLGLCQVPFIPINLLAVWNHTTAVCVKRDEGERDETI